MPDFDLDPPDTPDLYDEITAPADPWPEPQPDEHAVEHEQTPRRERRALTKLQQAWAQEFDPLAAVPDAVLTVKRYLELIKPTSRRNTKRLERIADAVKAIGLEGVCQADYAAANGIDPGFLSRLRWKTMPNACWC